MCYNIFIHFIVGFRILCVCYDSFKHVSLCICLEFLCGAYLEGKWLGQRKWASLTLIYCLISLQFAFQPADLGVSVAPHACRRSILLDLMFCRSDGCEMISLWFKICNFLFSSDAEHLFMCLLCRVVFFFFFLLLLIFFNIFIGV